MWFLAQWLRLNRELFINDIIYNVKKNFTETCGVLDELHSKRVKNDMIEVEKICTLRNNRVKEYLALEASVQIGHVSTTLEASEDLVKTTLRTSEEELMLDFDILCSFE